MCQFERSICASLIGCISSDLDLNPSLKTIVSFSALVMESDFIHPSPIKNRRLPPCRRFYFTDFFDNLYVPAQFLKAVKKVLAGPKGRLSIFDLIVKLEWNGRPLPQKGLCVNQSASH